MSSEHLATTGHSEVERAFVRLFKTFPQILYFGNWDSYQDRRYPRRCNTQFSAFEFSFRGSTVRWLGTRGPDHGFADVYLDGLFQETVDNYAQTRQEDLVKFEKTGIEGDRVHTLRVVVRKDRNPRATDCYQDVTATEAEQPVNYPAEIAQEMDAEYERIRSGTKAYLPPEEWSPVPNGADAPERGVTLGPGPLKDVLDRNVDYLNHSFASPSYCDGVDWGEWLPGSNEGRFLAGAGNTLRWGEREDMRRIVDTIIDRVEARMRDDGYFSYYAEDESYALSSGRNSERKNYDRVFWTRGMIAAGMVGNEKAYGLLRRMYDWFNASPYLPDMLIGSNATNGLPGGPLVYLSPAGVKDDLITTLRYYDQDYWMRALANREPLALSHYPGERPHCYALLGFEAFVDQYRATGDTRYLDAVLGGWDIYTSSFKHVGGVTTICERADLYPPKSYILTTPTNGETCGSIFWIDINSKLLQLFPTEERFASEVEESIYNGVLAAQDDNGYIIYKYLKLEGEKLAGSCRNTCCEVSTAGLMGRLPEFIYSLAGDGIYVNLFSPSEITWFHAGREVRLTTTTDFPLANDVSIRISTAGDVALATRIRIPSWATGEVAVRINGSTAATGKPGSYLSLERTWADGDTISFSLPIGFSTTKYTGFDQITGNLDRYALHYGPLLMALTGELKGPDNIPRIGTDAKGLIDLLEPVEGNPLAFDVRGHPGYRFVPYWQVETETFTCFPIVQA